MSHETAIEPFQPAQTQIHRRIAGLAKRQHGVVSRRQLLELGFSRHQVTHRLGSAYLHRVHPGVYAVGHSRLSPEGRWFAGVLAGGRGAVLSHRSAAALWGMRPVAASARTEIAVAHATRSSSSLLRHRVELPADEVTLKAGIPVTTVSRTLLDLATVVSSAELERAVREAEFLRLPDRPPLAELLARYPRRRGSRTVRATLERLSRLASGRTRSHLEDRFLRFLAQRQLPMPETNVVLRLDGCAFEADCLWRSARLIVELDGHESHGTRAAFESDRERDRRLRVAGWTVIRVTHRQLTAPDDLAADLRKLLGHDKTASMPPVAA